MDELVTRKFQIRPRFSIETQLSVPEIHVLFKEKFANEKTPFDIKQTEGFISIFPFEKDHHYWSPHLSVIVEASENVSLLRGHYGPSPAVWTMFIFLYAAIGLAIVIFTVIGFANRSIGLSSGILFAVPLLILVFCSLYLVSYIGQKKGHDQIEAIHQIFEGIIGKEILKVDL